MLSDSSGKGEGTGSDLCIPNNGGFNCSAHPLVDAGVREVQSYSPASPSPSQRSFKKETKMTQNETNKPQTGLFKWHGGDL